MNYLLIVLCTVFSFFAVNCAVVEDNGDVEEQGLYSKSDNVEILTRGNFDRKIYGKKHPWMVQFYNTYCGHCRSFAPKFKTAASDIIAWKNVMKLAVLDCSEEENNEICREFEVMAYPSLRYFHENYQKGRRNLGDFLLAPETADKFKALVLFKMQNEQSLGRLTFAPPLKIESYATYTDVMRDVPKDTLYTFLVFENENSTIGCEIALDLNEFKNIRVKRVYGTSELADVAGIMRFPGLLAIGPNLEATQLTPINPVKTNLINAIKSFLQSRNYVLPTHDAAKVTTILANNPSVPNLVDSDSDVVYYSDLEKTIKTSLHTEITRRKLLTGEPLQALIDYLDVLISSFPFKGGNLKEYITDLRNTLTTRTEWDGSDLYELLVTRLESTHAPVYISNLEYVGCKGSQPKYRGYTCGLWELYHTLLVNAADSPSLEGPKILRAMHGYVKHFFGCTDCANHFQALAIKNKLFDVKDNDKAVLWLWISHNEVNLRLAGDVTEDPEHPKIQFPSISKCPACRLPRGSWNLQAVFEYLQSVYRSNNIQDTRHTRSAVAVPSFSKLDIGMLSLLYILSFSILLLVIKLFLTKRFYRKHYKHGRGKV